MRFHTIWKQFNSYTLRQYRKTKTKKVFAYEHPDLIKKYLEEGPCKGCQFEKLCDVPCPQYYGWWDARMALLRKKYGLEK
jgi:radical SAM protein with 4Fe4S-binding SPASM domain